MDYTIFKFINGFAGQYLWLDTLAIFFAAFLQYVLGAGLVLWALTRRDATRRFKNLRITALAFGAAVISRYVFGDIIKRVVARPRPFDAHQVYQLIPYSAADVSFPSGHMAFFFALSTILFLYNKKAGIAFFAGSFLIGLSRIFVGLHYPLDILGGMVLGVLVGWGSYKIFSKKI